MPSDVRSIMKLEVPVIVQLGTRAMTINDVLSLAPGAIIELPKAADEELEILVNNKAIGSGFAVKVGENFGLKVAYIGDVKKRIQALGSAAPRAEEQDEADALTSSMVTEEA